MEKVKRHARKRVRHCGNEEPFEHLTLLNGFIQTSAYMLKKLDGGVPQNHPLLNSLANLETLCAQIRVQSGSPGTGALSNHGSYKHLQVLVYYNGSSMTN